MQANKSMNSDPYDLSPEFADVTCDEWDDPGETVAAAFPERLASIAHIHPDVRCEQSIRYLRNLDSRKAAITAEMDRLKAKLNAVENRREEVRDYLRSTMVLIGTRKVKTAIGTASLSAGREKIVLDEERIEQHIAEWPVAVLHAAVTYPPPKVSKTVLQQKFADRLKDLPGVSVECGDDVLTIR